MHKKGTSACFCFFCDGVSFFSSTTWVLGYNGQDIGGDGNLILVVASSALQHAGVFSDVKGATKAKDVFFFFFF